MALYNTISEETAFLESLLGDKPIQIIEVHSYGSARCSEVFFCSSIDEMKRENDPAQKKLLEMLDKVEKKLQELNLYDNKIVVKLNLGDCCIFVRFLEDCRSIGHGVERCNSNPIHKLNPPIIAS